MKITNFIYFGPTTAGASDLAVMSRHSKMISKLGKPPCIAGFGGT